MAIHVIQYSRQGEGRLFHNIDVNLIYYVKLDDFSEISGPFFLKKMLILFGLGSSLSAPIATYDVINRIVSSLNNRPSILIVDNADYFQQECILRSFDIVSFIENLKNKAPSLKIIITSRENVSINNAI